MTCFRRMFTAPIWAWTFALSLPISACAGHLKGADDTGSADTAVDDVALVAAWTSEAESTLERRAGGVVIPVVATDVDGDGADDLLVWTYASDGNPVDFLVPGPIPAGASILEDVGRAWTGGTAAGFLTRGLDAADLDGDGVKDVLLGANAGGDYAGAVYLIPSGAEAPDLQMDAAAHLTGRPEESAGSTVRAIGDTDGDGLAEFAVGAPSSYWSAGDDPGRVYRLHSMPSGSGALADVADELIGTDPDDETGTAISGVGDTDGDGLDDVVVSAPWAATVYLLRGGWIDGQLAEDADARVVGATGEDTLGAAVGAVGDWDGDGLADIAVGGAFYGHDEPVQTPGVAAVFAGDFTGTASLGMALLQVSGSDDVGVGGTVSSAGDLDGDGLPELLTGAGARNSLMIRGSTRGHIMPGDPGSALLVHDESGYFYGPHMVSGSDLDGDDVPDVVLTAYPGPMFVLSGALIASRL